MYFATNPSGCRDNIFHCVLPGPNKRIFCDWDIGSFQLQHRLVQRVHGGEPHNVDRLRKCKEQRISGGFDPSPVSLPSEETYSSFPTSQLRFNPTNPSILYASFRRSTNIYSWDLRGDTSIPLQVFQASDLSLDEISNQKLMFDIDYAGKWLGVGDNVRLGFLQNVDISRLKWYFRREVCASSICGTRTTRIHQGDRYRRH